MYIPWSGIEEVAYCFVKVICPISMSQRNRRFVYNLSIFRWQLQFGFTGVYEMTHIASRSMEGVPYCFLGHLSYFKVTLAGKSTWIWFELDYKASLSFALLSLRFALLFEDRFLFYSSTWFDSCLHPLEMKTQIMSANLSLILEIIGID